MSNREKFLLDLAYVMGNVNESETCYSTGDILRYAICNVGCYYRSSDNDREYVEQRLEVLYTLHSMIMQKCSSLVSSHAMYKHLIDALFFLHKTIVDVKQDCSLLVAKVVDPDELFGAGPYDGE